MYWHCEPSQFPFIAISITSQSPNLSKYWLEIIIENINQKMREIDKDSAKNSISYLQQALLKTNFEEQKRVISLLLKDQMQTLMLSEVNEEYVFKVLDSPLAPEKKSGPSRAFICIFITISSFLISIISIFFHALLRREI